MVRIGELAGTSSADPCGLAWKAPTMVMLSPPAAAKTGGAVPTLAMSPQPAPIARNIGGPGGKPNHAPLDRRVPINPGPGRNGPAPPPAPSPNGRATPEATR